MKSLWTVTQIGSHNQHRIWTFAIFISTVGSEPCTATLRDMVSCSSEWNVQILFLCKSNNKTHKILSLKSFHEELLLTKNKCDYYIIAQNIIDVLM